MAGNDPNPSSPSPPASPPGRLRRWLGRSLRMLPWFLVVVLFLAVLGEVTTNPVDVWRVSQVSLGLSAQQKRPPPNATLQTEQLFVENAAKDVVQDASVLEEWRAARGDHKIVAFAIANCLKISDLVSMSRQDFATLLLDLRPTGEHFLFAASAGIDPPEQLTTNGTKLDLSAYEQSVLLLSDALARARVAAAAGAAWNYPGVTEYGWYAVAVSALATLFITLKSAMSAATRDGKTRWIQDPTWWRNFAFGAFGILAIIFSTLGTVLTSVKQFYDPTRAYLRNETALANLRTLHQQVALSFIGTVSACEGSEDFRSKLFPTWTAQLADMQKILIKAAVPLPGIDGDAGPGKLPPPQNPPTATASSVTPAALPAPAPAPRR